MLFDLSSLPIAQAQSGTGMRETIDALARTPLSQVVMFVTVLTILRLAIWPTLKNTKPHLRTAKFGAARFLNEFLDAVIYAGIVVFMLIRPFAVQAFLIPSGSMWPALYVGDFIVANKAIYRYSDPKEGDIVVFRPPPEAAAYPSQLDSEGVMKEDFIKRCIGVPGDVVELREGVLYRNGQRVVPDTDHYSSCTDTSGAPECGVFTELSKEQAGPMPNFKLVVRGKQVMPLVWSKYDVNQAEREVAKAYAFPPDTAPDSPAAKLFVDQPAQPVPKGYYLMMGDNRNNSFDGRAWGLVPRESIIGRAELIWLPFNRISRLR